MTKVQTMKSELSKSPRQRYQNFLNTCVSGEYFLLSDQTSRLLSNFVTSSEDMVGLTSVEDLKLPFNQFCLDYSLKVNKTNDHPSYAWPTQNLLCIYKEENRLWFTQCTKYESKDKTYYVPSPFVCRLEDIDKNAPYDYDLVVYKNGTSQIFDSYLKDGVLERGVGGPILGVNFHVWSESYFQAVKTDEYMKDMSEECFGLPFALFGIKMSLAFCLIRTGIKKEKTQRTVIPTKKVGKKRLPPRKQSFTVVTLDSVETFKDDSIQMKQGVSAHTVRGHFKKKKNGIFWWNPFVRGSGPRTEREAYLVKE